MVLQKKGMALFSIVHIYEKGGKPEEKNFEKLIDLVKCHPETEWLSLTHAFWQSCKKIKTFKPRYKTVRNNQSFSDKAKNALKTLLKKGKDLNQELIAFIRTLLKDINKYKTLPANTL